MQAAQARACPRRACHPTLRPSLHLRWAVQHVGPASRLQPTPPDDDRPARRMEAGAMPPVPPLTDGPAPAHLHSRLQHGKVPRGPHGSRPELRQAVEKLGPHQVLGGLCRDWALPGCCRSPAPLALARPRGLCRICRDRLHPLAGTFPGSGRSWGRRDGQGCHGVGQVRPHPAHSNDWGGLVGLVPREPAGSDVAAISSGAGAKNR